MERFESDFKKFIFEAKRANTHPAKLIVFSDFLRNIFDLKIKEIISGVEVYLSGTSTEIKNIYQILGGIKSGRIDLLLPNIITELKVNYNKELKTGKLEILNYFRLLKKEKPSESFNAIITDLLKYSIYKPIINSKNEVIDIELINEINIEQMSFREFILWFDSYFFSLGNLRPSAYDLDISFGIKTPFFLEFKHILFVCWNEVEKEKDVILKLKVWKKHLQLVYGSDPKMELFFRHTYLVTLIKLIIYIKINPNFDINKIEIMNILNGSLFSKLGLINLIEEDYFSWILHDKIYNKIEKITTDLMIGLNKYDFSDINTDLFKEIYENLIKLEEKHSVGEYYTPEWLADFTVHRLFQLWQNNNKDNKEIPYCLDPACGSGTFLTNTIYLFKEHYNSLDESKLLNEILSHIVGIDVNPIAVITSRANYIIALDNLINLGIPIQIPIFNANSIEIPPISKESLLGIKLIQFETVGKNMVQIPTDIVINNTNYGKLLQLYRKVLYEYEESQDFKQKSAISRSIKYFQNEIQKLSFIPSKEYSILEDNLHKLIQLINQNENSIWLYVLNNYYSSFYYTQRKCDILMGNPPWIIMRSFAHTGYQEFLKSQSEKYNLLPDKIPTQLYHKELNLEQESTYYLSKIRSRLFSEMELASLFTCKVIDLYLKKNGLLGFILPISTITGYNQHVRFRDFNKPVSKLIEIHNFEDVSPIFSLPTCCLIVKKGSKTEYPVNEILYSANLSEFGRNALLKDVQKIISKQIRYKQYIPSKLPKEFSIYFKEAYNGITLIPRCFWFIDFITKTRFNISLPHIQTDNIVNAVGKRPWKEINLKGFAENEYIFSTLLGKDMVPFGHLKFRPIVLPIEIGTGTKEGKYIRILNNETILNKAPEFGKWIQEAQQYWENCRTKKSAKEFPTLQDRLDYQNAFKNIQYNKKFMVLWNARGANSYANVINIFEKPRITIKIRENELILETNGFIPDSTLYIISTNSELEAHYICAVLNSPLIHKAVKPFQPKGLYGYRDIYKRPTMMPIPKFDTNNVDHKKIANISIECHEIVNNMKFNDDDQFRTRRNAIRKELELKYDEINKIVNAITDINLSLLEENNIIEDEENEEDE